MARLADPTALAAHRARFDVGGLARDGLDPLETARLEALLERPYEGLDARDVTSALAIAQRATGHASLFAYFLPAALRRPPYRDVLASERLLAGLLASRGDGAVSAWDVEIEDTLVRWLHARPLRGGDDPVDLWLSEAAARRRALDAARRLGTKSSARSGWTSAWMHAAEAPLYARAGLLLLHRYPASAERRFRLWEASGEDNLLRAWVEVMFHAHGEGWRPESPMIDGLLAAPERTEVADGLMGHPELDLALGAAGVTLLLSPRRGREVRARIEGRLRALDASDQDRFVLLPTVRRLLEGP